MRPTTKRLAGIVGALALAAGTGLGSGAADASAQEAPPEGGQPKDFRLAEPIEFELSNGLGVTMVPYGNMPKVAVQLVVRAGNIDEAADEVWLADLMADLMKEGTATRSAEDIAREAAAMGGSVNVGVGLDQSSVTGQVLAEYGPELVALIADVALNPAFPESELERLKADRIRQVSISRQQAEAQTVERFRAVMYPDHPYGRLYPTEEALQGYTLDQIRAFYEANFGAARSHLYVMGVFDPGTIRGAIETAFGDWKEGLPPATNVPQAVTGRAVHLVNRPGAPQSTIFVGLPTIDPSHEDWVALQVTNMLLGGSFASRISRNIREDKGYTYSPFSQLSTRYRDAYWVQTADVSTDVTGASLDEIFYEIERLTEEPPSAEELEGIQNFVAGIFVLQNSSRFGIAGQLAFMRLHGLPDDWLETYVERIYAVTPEEVQRIMREYIRAEDMLLVVTGDRAQVEEQLVEFGTPIVD
jgi:predicted Zn-dependent peptidase